MFTILTSRRFERHLRKFLKQHPGLQGRFEGIVDDLILDPFAPHLVYHHLSGKLKGFQAISLTDSYRITLTVVISEKEITLVDIGSHDEVYR